MKYRYEIEDKYKWDLTTYYKTEKAFYKDFEIVKKNKKLIKNYENKLTDRNCILNCLNLSSYTSEIFERLYVFANLKQKEDVTNAENEQRAEKVSILSVELSEATYFIDVEILENDVSFIKSLSKDKDFKKYKKYLLELLKEKKHLLSKNEEKLLSSISEFSDGFSDVFDKFENADVKFEDVIDENNNKHNLSQSNYYVYVQSADRAIRKSAGINLHKGFGDYNYTLASNYINHLKKNNFYAKIRKHKSVLSASLYSEDIKNKVYYNLINSVNKNQDIMYDYYEIKRKELKLDKIALYDMAAPLYDIPARNPSYDESYKIVIDALKPLGNQYTNLLKEANEKRWIDIYPNKGKDNGAFSWGAYGKNPVVLLNYENTLNDTFTLAHELGHAMHTYFSNKNQPFQTAGYEIFVAEVASTTNEMLLLRYLLSKTEDKNEKKYYFDYFMRMVRTTIFRQTMFAEFEEKMHDKVGKKVPLSADILNNYYYELNKKYYGENVELYDEIKYEWSRIPHFYNSFYVYKYATGLIASIIISEKLFNNEENYVNKYINFLSSGCKYSPIKLLQKIDVDLENVETFAFAFKSVKNMLDKWKELI